MNTILPKVYVCKERKDFGNSVINKPVDLHLRRIKDSKIVMAIEVACVNITQLVGEVSTLFFDNCPIRLLILRKRNVPTHGVIFCSDLMSRLYGQNDVTNTPARIVNFDDKEALKKHLRDLLFIF